MSAPVQKRLLEMDKCLASAQEAVDVQLSQLSATVAEVLQNLSPPALPDQTGAGNHAEAVDAFQDWMDGLVKDSKQGLDGVGELKKHAFVPTLTSHRDALKQLLS
ncbi:hypothetical protein BASA81_008283 [Batrachochytrium salamandrivorans]|nr:hypothetical protein BASA81_008283 [Batrachochytrium salamandrivorans]